jgi:hypothetical protein
MEKIEYQFEDFLLSVSEEYKEFVTKAHEMLLNNNWKIKIESKASGLFASYSHPKTRRSILNVLFRKKGLFVRIYGDNCGKYPEVLNSLPDKIVNQIEKAGVCKRLVDPASCNPKCVLGYDFYIGERHFQKCRNSCFYFEIDHESIPFLLELIESEVENRLAVLNVCR